MVSRCRESMITDGVRDADAKRNRDDPRARASGLDAVDFRACGPRDLDPVALYLRDTRRVSRSSRRGRCQQEGKPGEWAVCARGRRRLVLTNLGLVVVTAKRYRRLGLPLGDLIQEGNLGLLAAARRFEPATGVDFAGYATGWIRHTICRALSVQPRLIRIPLRRVELQRHAALVVADAEQRHGNEGCAGGHGRPPEPDAREDGISVEELRSVIAWLPEVESLDATPPGADRARRLTIPDTRSPDPAHLAAQSEERGQLRAAVRRLPERLRIVLERRFGLDGRGRTSLARIGVELGISAERVRQLQNRGLALLRQDPRLAGPASNSR